MPQKRKKIICKFNPLTKKKPQPEAVLTPVVT